MAYWRAVGLSFHISTTGSGLAWVCWSQTASVTRISILTSFWILPNSTSSVYLQQHSFDEASSIETVHGMRVGFATGSTVWHTGSRPMKGLSGYKDKLYDTIHILFGTTH